MGTVIGMIQAFDDIAAAGDISPTIVASGIKVALLTTVFGFDRCNYFADLQQLHRIKS